jgi:hypothetical protein
MARMIRLKIDAEQHFTSPSVTEPLLPPSSGAGCEPPIQGRPWCRGRMTAKSGHSEPNFGLGMKKLQSVLTR